MQFLEWKVTQLSLQNWSDITKHFKKKGNVYHKLGHMLLQNRKLNQPCVNDR